MIAYSNWPACSKSYHMKAKTTKKNPKCKTRQKNKITLSHTTKYELLFLMDWTQFWQIQHYIKWYIVTNLHDKVPLSFLFDPF